LQWYFFQNEYLHTGLDGFTGEYIHTGLDGFSGTDGVYSEFFAPGPDGFTDRYLPTVDIFIAELTPDIGELNGAAGSCDYTAHRTTRRNYRRIVTLRPGST
jgi:hypothetical protein